MVLHTHLKSDEQCPLTALLLLGLIAGLARADHTPTAASVDLINGLNDSVVVHCWSRDTDLGSVSVFPALNYYWNFHPNIFGHTLFKCNFRWRQEEQEFAVWKGSSHPDRPPCCAKGLCSYKICPDGFYNALMVETDDYGPAESWEFYEGWVPTFNP